MARSRAALLLPGGSQRKPTANSVCQLQRNRQQVTQTSCTGLQVREQQKFDATYEDVSAMLHKFMNQNQSLETGS